MTLLRERRTSASSRLASLQADLRAAGELARDRACVYVTGSYGRGEASEHSDLDLFVVARVAADSEAAWLPDAARLTGELAAAKRAHGFLDSPGTEGYGLVHSVDALVSALGQSHDDAENTFTARLLLLLESRALVEDAVYSDVIDRVLRAYWRDFDDHRDSFVPGYLANDILRLWRTFCVNYEARTQSEPANRKAKRTLKNYKLKHSRLLTCYSALAYLLMVFAQKRTVTLDDARAMVELSPTARIESIGARFSDAAANATRIISLYEHFLSVTDSPESALIARFLDRDQRRPLMREASELGDAMYELIRGLGGDNKLYRLLVV